ncbi:RWD domain-containing protein 4 [Dendroctonus ponderosae]|uniref:RWD domain-containing protein n=1 Tax=Dendroctonus ponderosae TaxID=77166 RepID=J3JVU3_DENPD|nr:RWD domain-containing protein 4 [Dendroctonus ponderosae]AEE62323.1 unknown [Dendroctonus ponderosae]ERL90593.1 hypothetical protein D910_07940 [Dendroctonus ponderosae]KAH1003290.1 hypothetical protein HUJ05_011217 [Dendroctonus ponderosae]
MEQEGLQEEEREVLQSIYEGDECFKQLDARTFQYKYGASDPIKTLLVELKWGPNYPEERPQVNLDVFYNRHLLAGLKAKVQQLVETEAEQYLGMSMTYSLFEFVKERFEELIEEQPEHALELEVDKLSVDEQESLGAKREKKEQLTKAQKRRQWNRLDAKGEKPRGWDWVDIVKHLSQTGSKEDGNPGT